MGAEELPGRGVWSLGFQDFSPPSDPGQVTTTLWVSVSLLSDGRDVESFPSLTVQTRAVLGA